MYCISDCTPQTCEHLDFSHHMLYCPVKLLHWLCNQHGLLLLLKEGEIRLLHAFNLL